MRWSGTRETRAGRGMKSVGELACPCGRGRDWGVVVSSDGIGHLACSPPFGGNGCVLDWRRGTLSSNINLQGIQVGGLGGRGLDQTKVGFHTS